MTAFPPDTGCRYAPSCQNCPFPVCYLDDPEAFKRKGNNRRERNLEIVRHYNGGETQRELAKAFGLSRTTIKRIIKGSSIP